jgi:hypothetical protein
MTDRHAGEALEIGFEAYAIDRALESRSELSAEFFQLLDRFESAVAAFLRNLPEAIVNLLSTLVYTACVMDERIRKSPDYDWQQVLTPNRGGFGNEAPVVEMRQPKRYREVRVAAELAQASITATRAKDSSITIRSFDQGRRQSSSCSLKHSSAVRSPIIILAPARPGELRPPRALVIVGIAEKIR